MLEQMQAEVQCFWPRSTRYGLLPAFESCRKTLRICGAHPRSCFGFPGPRLLAPHIPELRISTDMFRSTYSSGLALIELSAELGYTTPASHLTLGYCWPTLK